MSKATANQLRKWRRLLLVRDAVVVHQRPGERALHAWHCPICGPEVFYRGEALQAHHIWPKARYPMSALYLNNGIMVCTAHHQGIVHGFNASADSRLETALAAWFKWCTFLTERADTGNAAQFNRVNQAKLTA